jgi:hypothetical protein
MKMETELLSINGRIPPNEWDNQRDIPHFVKPTDKDNFFIVARNFIFRWAK